LVTLARLPAPIKIEFFLKEPLVGWVKCNTDGAAGGAPVLLREEEFFKIIRASLWVVFQLI